MSAVSAVPCCLISFIKVESTLTLLPEGDNDRFKGGPWSQLRGSRSQLGGARTWTRSQLGRDWRQLGLRELGGPWRKLDGPRRELGGPRRELGGPRREQF